MRKLIIFCILLLALGAHGVDRVTLSITVTNLPVTGNNLAFTAPASKVITWSNITTTAYIATNTTVNGCATNLFLHFAAFAPWSPRPTLVWVNTNQFNLEADCGQVITVTNSGTWATLEFDTNSCAGMRAVRVPIASEKFATSRVEIASLLVKGLNDYPTNTFDTNAPALTNYLSLGPHTQVIRGIKNFYTLGSSNFFGTNGALVGSMVSNVIHLHGSNINFAHGYATNIRADKLISTGLVNYGSAISSPGANSAGLLALSLQVGESAEATNTAATALGAFAVAGGNGSLAVGNGALSTNEQSMAFGASSIAGGYRSIVMGVENAAYGYESVAINGNTDYTHTNSIAIGGDSTDKNQITLGSAATIAHVRAPGRVESGSYTNALFTGTNIFRGDVAWEEVSVSTLANGNNIAAPATNKFIRLVASGPTAAFTINGLQGGRSGRELIIWNDTGQAMTFAHESGVDPTPANRIFCTSQGDYVFPTNAIGTLIYSAGRSRWVFGAPNTNSVLANNSVTDGILRDSAALSVIGRSANSSGDPADIAAAADGLFLGRTNSTVGFIKVGLTNLSMYNVNPVSQSAGQVLAWDGTSNIWTNKSLQLTNSSLSNVMPVGQSAGQVLAWDGTSNVWTNRGNGAVTMTMYAGVSGLNPVDATTYYFGGAFDAAIGTTEAAVQVPVPGPTGWTGKVKSVAIKIRVAGTLGTTEDVAHYVRNVTAATDSGVLNIDYDAATKEGYIGSLDLAVTAGDALVIKIVTPTWVTNPTTVRAHATVYIE